MYNAEMKNAFLGTIANDNSYKAYVRIFNAVEDMETGFNKDVCEMNVDEIFTVLDLKTGTRSNNIIHVMSLLRTYIDWCIQNGKVVGENNLDKIDFKDIDQSRTIKLRYLKDEAEFEEMCSVVYKRDAFYNETSEMQKELIVRLCFLGLDNEEIVTLKKTDVDVENGILKSPLYPDIEYKVDRKIIDLCVYCIEQEEFMYSAPSKGTEMRYERLCNNDYVIRPRIGTLRGKDEDSPMNVTNIPRRTNTFFKDYYEATEIYKELSPNRLRESGMLIQIHKSDNPEYFIDTAVKTEILLKNPKISQAKLKERIRNIKHLYSVWSNAFYG